MRDRLVAYLPRYAPWAARAPGLMNLRDQVPGLATLSERMLGISRHRSLPQWHRPWRPTGDTGAGDADLVLFGDTFNRYFEPDNLAAAETVLQRAGLSVATASPTDGRRPLCCGRTFLTAGLVREAETEMRRTLAALRPALDRGTPVVGLEPSCLLTFRDEAPALLGKDWHPDWSNQFVLFEEYIAARLDNGGFDLPLAPIGRSRALLHGHCHQKSFDVMAPVERALRLVPDLDVETIASSCCGMAGAFGYQAETLDVSRAMAELSLLPAIRAADDNTLVVADGTSCRHQIADGVDRTARHVAVVLRQASDRALQ